MPDPLIPCARLAAPQHFGLAVVHTVALSSHRMLVPVSLFTHTVPTQ